MATEVYLGYPPPNVRRWIEEEYKKKKTIITFDNESTEEYEWTGEVNREKLVQAGIFDIENGEWLKNPVSIQFGTTVTTIGGYAFNECFNLTSVSMPNVTTVGGYAFNECFSLTSVSMPNVTTVGSNAFNECFSLTSVSMPNVTTVGSNAFSSCQALTSVSMPNVQTIGSFAFYGCSNLTSVSMPNVTTVSEYAFNYCLSLTYVAMPSVTSIGNDAFTNISTPVEFENQTTSQISEWFGSGVFGGSWGPATIVCSNGSVSAVWDYSEETWTITITLAQ